jgi:hypothetical protein
MSAIASACALSRPAFRVRASASDGAAKKVVSTPSSSGVMMSKAPGPRNTRARAIQVDTSAEAKDVATKDPLMLRAIRGEDVERPPIWCARSRRPPSPSRVPAGVNIHLPSISFARLSDKTHRRRPLSLRVRGVSIDAR